MKVVAIIQARVSSSRLPAKVMLNLQGKTLLERVIERVKLAEIVDDIWVATSTNSEDSLIQEVVDKNNINCYRGDLENVFDRFVQVIEQTKPNIVVRITADNPLTEPKLIDYGVNYILEQKVDYVGYRNTPIGAAVEVFTAESFMKISSYKDLTKHNLEHVTSYYYQHDDQLNIRFIDDFYNEPLNSFYITVDTYSDYIRMAKYYTKFSEQKLNPREYLDSLIKDYIQMDEKTYECNY